MHTTSNINLHNLIEGLIIESYTSGEQPSYHTAGLWWKECWELDGHLPEGNLHQLIHLAFKAPNFSCAFVAAYQTALRLMFPHLAGEGNLACLCVSEKGGNSPKVIETTLKEQRISGEKTFVTCADQLDTLLIMLDEQDTSNHTNQIKNPRPQKNLILVQIDNIPSLSSPSLILSTSPFNIDKFLPDIGKGSLLLNSFPIEEEHKFDGDAHENYSKPFSVLEGLCIRLAMCSHLLKWACVYQWPKSVQADLILQIVALESALNSPHSSSTQIVIDAQNRLMERLIPAIDEQAEHQAKFKEHWQRDKICLYMDFRLREKRLADAWLALNT